MDNDDFKFEPVRGLPEALPADEHILWQGQPNALRLAKDAWKLNWVLGYFAVLAVGRVIISSADVSLTVAMAHGLPFLLAGVIVGLMLLGLATVQARSTVYTLTNKRACMRIGAALTMTLNLPYVCIGNAQALVRKSGLGTITFEMIGDARISYLMTWPHVRPWHITRTQPAFRAIADAARVAAIFADAAETRVSQPQITRISPANAPAADAIAAE
ncbi:photosynthetic complex putative assembly protein PuhB [Pseudosulfitobacter koreensis]|uniref:Photosynthetic complex putative assembly protein PuhB n=1 Tax=Pseudosulfitobacter koreensis TaxID=2968472 RepID=A0ABT1YWJ1_9RHOB|nr:photosynthetic complex putative assembly protein PuhB [Pseudosulfitobacter koreense]MCR8825201.1 photosynthetic complex putative assembly protein PuhB [Pseudosulfitobacter koreense]